MTSSATKKEKRDKLGLESVKSSEEEQKIDTVISFERYFRIILHKNPSIRAHHKAPMQKYAELKGVKEATESQFDEIFRSY